MRTLIAAALAFALAIPATASTAAACGDDADFVRHTATGTMGFMDRNDAGELTLFVSYPTVDGEWSGLYGIDATVFQDRVAQRLERDKNRWERRFGGPVMIEVELERFGDDGAWRVVSYHLHRAA